MPPTGIIKHEEELQAAFERAERVFQEQLLGASHHHSSGPIKREPVFEDSKAMMQASGMEIPTNPHHHQAAQHCQFAPVGNPHVHYNQPEARPQPEQRHKPITFNFRAALENRPVDVLEEVVGKANNLLDEIKKAVNDCGRTEKRGNFDNTMLIKQIDEVRSKAKQAKTIIGVVGNTGAGKSSVINALLDEEKIVPTNCMRACTAVVTEISYNYDTDDKYRAEIEFISKKDWEDELNILFDDILSSGDFDRDSGRPDTEAGIAWSKVKAVYPRSVDNRSFSGLHF
jgi:ABC-type glutathione transport system ATPase component